MKRRISVIVSMISVLSLTACTILPGNANYGDKTERTPQAALNLEWKEYGEPEKHDINAGNSEEVSFDSIMYQIDNQSLSNWESDDNTYYRMTQTGYETILIPDEYAALKKAVDKLNSEIVKEYESLEEDYEKDWKDHYSGTEMVITDEMSIMVTRADERFFSFTIRRNYGYGEMVDSTYYTVNLDSETGDSLSADKFVNMNDEFYSYLAKYVMDNYYNDNLNCDTEAANVEAIRDILEKEGLKDERVSVLDNGVEIIFNLFDLSCTDTINVPIFYDEHPELLAENVFTKENDEYIRRFTPDFRWYEDVNGDGNKEALSIDYEMGYMDGDMVYTTMSVGDGRINAECSIFSLTKPNVYVAKRGEELYLFAKFEGWGSGDVLDVMALRCDENELITLSSHYGYINTLVDFDNIYFDYYYGIFSTFVAKGSYYVDENGGFVQKDEFLEIYPMDDMYLTVKNEIYGNAVDDNLNVSDKRVDIPVGSILYFRYTNGQNGVIVENEDGDYIYLERDEDYQICGMDENDAFEVLWYYG